MYFVNHWSLGSQIRCVDVLLLITNPIPTRWANILTETLTNSIIWHATWSWGEHGSILPCKGITPTPTHPKGSWGCLMSPRQGDKPFCHARRQTSPHRQKEAWDVWCLPPPPVWNLRAVIWFHFTISCLVLLLVSLLFLSSLFSAYWSSLLTFFSSRFFNIFVVKRLSFWSGFCLAARRWQLISGMCSMLPYLYGTSIFHYLFRWYFLIFHCFCPFFFFHKLLKSGIDKSDESPWYQHVLALCAFFFLVNRGVSDQLFLRKFVFDVCMFCLSRLILWIHVEEVCSFMTFVLNK